MAVKFPLKMADGAMVRTLEELREHFDMASVLAYYEDGRLKRWLGNGYYDNEAAQVDALNASSENFIKELCEVLRLDGIQSDVMRQVDLGDAKKKNKRIESLKKITADDRILSAVDRVAFTQEELDDLVDHHVGEIYLCGECFMIPECETDITYIGVNNPIVRYDGKTMSAEANFQNLRLDLDSYIGDFVDGQREGEAFFNLFEKNLPLGIKLLCSAADNGPAKIQTFLGTCYEHGRGVDKNAVEAVRWYRKAAEQGYAAAQNIMGNVYNNGYSVQQDFVEAVQWYRKAAEQGSPEAQNSLANMYWKGKGIEQSYEEANQWYLRAANLGYHWAQCNLGTSYKDGKGISQSDKEAVKWLKKAVAQGNENAKAALLELEPTLFSLSEVIIHAVGGTGNLITGTTMDKDAGKIDIVVDDRSRVDEELLRRFGVTNVWVENEYCYEMRKKDVSLKEVAFAATLPALWIAKKLFTDDDGTEFVPVDYGQGRVHIQMKRITSAMEKDFNKNVKKIAEKM